MPAAATAGPGKGKAAGQDDHTAADYYFDSYSHFGERGERREGRG